MKTKTIWKLKMSPNFLDQKKFAFFKAFATLHPRTKFC